MNSTEQNYDLTNAYVTLSSIQGWIITGAEMPVEYADGIQMEPVMFGPYATESVAHLSLNAMLRGAA